MTHNFDALVLGAGAAGLMCAVEAGKRGRRVAVLERAERVGKKILISGGGRCNFTNIYCQPENFISHNPHFVKSALARYTPADFVAWIKKHRIPYHDKRLGQLFCDRSAHDVVSMLERECRDVDVQLFLNTAIDELRRSTHFVVRAGETEFQAPAVVVATGGLSIPKMGATGFGYEVARQFGLAVRPTRPALVPLVLGTEDHGRYCDLAGISADVVASFGKQSFREKMLITHRGLSGPAILQVSSYWNKPQPIMIDLAPQKNVTAALRDLSSPRNLTAGKGAFRAVLANRFADRWLELHVPSNWANSAIEGLEHQLHQWAITPVDTEGYDKAEVTAGGVDTDGLSAKTMESRKVRGLFFIGEVVDVTGHLGGFNFQWAWASGACAGRAL
ncbi:MAG: NAD(P)/FAD-dependent oxidoreductase [Terriglobales bacterium]